ncbi:D-sorbitol dehydrogenase subunit SldB [Neokomagataea thailandica NBRC 106555]|uniref:Glycerol dehydrogenase n=2 Tax=Neokomagataea TaxID=1223423 RepID=A0A4Y6V7R2_9PROT|nr:MULTISPECIES: glycerol dehydrogenase [Neokomagataea]QDH24720.1 glycerol dehydrogenase [Neokomagataea tanensis]GBR53749.1 D-sorbitol dehydrogenase subunit SldB [Neokomagataea thailandica NBRC 106555]
MSNMRWPSHPRDWCAFVLGAIITLLGLPMVIMGADLIALGGSWYYTICGAVVVFSGIQIMLGRTIGATAYLLAWFGTAVWSLWEVGFDGWGLLPRLFGPSLIAILVLLIIPTLKRRNTHTSRPATSQSGAAF